MKHNKKNSSNTDYQDHIQPKSKNIRYPKQIHRTWWFWLFFILMLIGILYYITSVDFAFVPQIQVEQPSENNITL